MSNTLVETTNPLIDLEVIKKKTINLAIFGHGNVGERLINQIISAQNGISKRRDLDVVIFAVANSETVLMNVDGIDLLWPQQKKVIGTSYSVNDVINFANQNNLENLIAVDNTANSNFVLNYGLLVENGFNLVSSNKIGNTLGLDFYQGIRKTLAQHKREYLYETNVGAGLPLIDTIKLLHLSGENITRIKGVFSGSLSYIFNEFSEGKKEFSVVVREAITKGYTEPDPREDLCGSDVGRKLLILARELDLHNELSDISIENLVPDKLRNLTKEEFLGQLKELDVLFKNKRSSLNENQVLRYIGDLHGDLSKEDGAILTVKLVVVENNSVLGQLKGSDSLFEIYTESYGENPIVIQGAGAGATVTARGVFGDILRLSDRIN